MSDILTVLTQAGAGSRRQVVEAIKQGAVRVNNQPVENFRHPVDIRTDQITINGKPVRLKAEKPVYLLLNKPAGYLSTTHDERGRPTVLDLLPGKYRTANLHPAGRLDIDSTGLLLLTNDGSLTYRITHPKFEHGKEYLVTVAARLTAQEMQKLEEGVDLDDGLTSPAAVKELKKEAPFLYSINIHEGRKRQVRRMFAAVSHDVQSLKRVRIAGFTLGTLQEGQCKELTAREVSKLLNVKN